MHWLVDIDRLRVEGRISAELAEEMKRRAREDGAALGINTLLVAGIATVIAGASLWVSGPGPLAGLGAVVLAAGTAALGGLGERFRLPANAAALVGLAMALVGLLWRLTDAAESLAPAIYVGAAVTAAGLAWRTLGAARFAFIAGATGALGLATHLAGVLGSESAVLPGWLAMLYAGVATLACGVALDVRALSALAVPLLAAVFSTAAYSHAIYSLSIYESTLTILEFAAVALLCLAVTATTGERLARHARIVGLLAFVWINLAFWIGSLWGDVVGLYAWGPTWDAAAAGDWERHRAAVAAFEAEATRISADAFALVWAVLIVATGAWAVLTARRSIFNAAATFGAIHFYTQWFERLEQTPGVMIAAGVIAIAIAWGLVQLNAVLKARAAD